MANLYNIAVPLNLEQLYNKTLAMSMTLTMSG